MFTLFFTKPTSNTHKLKTLLQYKKHLKFTQWLNFTRCIFIFFCFLLLGCNDNKPISQDIQDDQLQEFVAELSLDPPKPAKILPGSTLKIRIRSGIPFQVISSEALLEGELIFGNITKTISITTVPKINENADPPTIEILADETLWSEITGREGIFKGILSLDLQGDNLYRGTGRTEPFEVELFSALTPSLTDLHSSTIYLGSQLNFSGSGFLLPGEGESILSIQGQFSHPSGNQEIGAVIPMTSEEEHRESAAIYISTSLFGTQVGIFSGIISVENRHVNGEIISDLTPIEVTLFLEESFISHLEPTRASRGEVINIYGRGFLNTDVNLDETTLFVLDGNFYTDDVVVDYSGPNALELGPDQILSDSHATLTFRPQPDSENWARLTGLGSQAGIFEGKISPLIIVGNESILGIPWQNELEVLPPKQIVYVAFLPGFSEGLVLFGLSNVETEIRQRIFEVVTRDYEGINIEFTDQRPEHFLQYSVIEVGGPDPNGEGLLGLDNTAGKDTNNIRLDDVIGGQNADSREEGYFSFGGVFLESFVSFSPILGSNTAIVSANFDELFGPFMNQLGGVPVEATEYPFGPRQVQIDMAITCLGNLIGNTITHEIGHSLGLSYFPEDELGSNENFHNLGDTPGQIMDSGAARSFEERCEIDGTPRPFFSEKNRIYLERILPVR